MIGDSRAIAKRIGRLMAALAVLGAVGFGVARGAMWGLSFLTGAILAGISFYLTHLLVEHLGPVKPGDDPPSASDATLMGMRYVVLGAAAYGTIRYLGLHLEALAGGLMVAVAAVLIEVLYELIHGT